MIEDRCLAVAMRGKGMKTVPHGQRSSAMIRFTACLALTLVSLASMHAKPNILLIYSDDHGWADLGAQGVNAEIKTPNLDQLARDGIRFTRGYVSAPQCVPSRAGVITGRYQQRFGVEDNGKGPLPLEELTIAERLKPAGYLTGQVGKWHLDLGAKGDGKDKRVMRALPAYMPHAQGFDEYFRGELRQFFASHDLQGRPFADAPHLVIDERFRVIVQTEAALSFLDRRTAKPEQPWFLYLAWYAPHVPLDSPEPWFSRTPANLPEERRQALSMIACMDDGLGRIRQKLRDMGADKNTLIFFIGDNGAPLGGAWNGSLNLPLIGQKGMLAEGGIRTPFVAAWPGTLPSGATYDKPVISLDVAATAVALAYGRPLAPRDEKTTHETTKASGSPATSPTSNAQSPPRRSETENLDGVNLMPFITGENNASPHDTLYWRWGSQAAIQKMPYKLIVLGDRDRLLFDISKPEGENITRNLAKAHPDIVARLEAKLKTWTGKLKPPGLPTSFDEHHEGLFAEHDLIPPPAAGKKPRRKAAPEGSVQGWICRNGSLSIKDGALVITPDATGKAPPFLSVTGLDLAGPVRLKMSVRAKRGGNGFSSWRTSEQKDFMPGEKANFEWPASNKWRDISAALPVTGKLIHLRIGTPRDGDGIEVRSIELMGHTANTPILWKFDRTAE